MHRHATEDANTQLGHAFESEICQRGGAATAAADNSWIHNMAWLMEDHPRLADFARSMLSDDVASVMSEATDLLLAAQDNKTLMPNQLKALLDACGKKSDRRYEPLYTALNRVLGERHDNPTTIEEADQNNDWPLAKELYLKNMNSLSKRELTIMMLMAPGNDGKEVFHNCLRRGGSLTGEQLCTAEDTNSEEPKDRLFKALFPLESPLHNALSWPHFDLSEMIEREKISFTKELANMKDAEDGCTLLFTAALVEATEQSIQNVKSLLRLGTDVNSRDHQGNSVLQHLLAKIERKDAKKNVDMLVALVRGAVECGQKIQWLPSVPGDWTALHVLCDTGAYEHVPFFVEHGADAKDLRDENRLTLIDTVILGNGMTLDRKINTLRVLLEDLKLGPYHADIVKNRLEGEYTTFAKTYRFPIKHLLKPVICTPSIKRTHLELIKLLWNNEAVGETERQFLASELQNIKDSSNKEMTEFLEQELEKFVLVPGN